MPIEVTASLPCPVCKTNYKEPSEVETIIDWGYCLSCDKLDSSKPALEYDEE
jgi:hypothetical protein